MIYIVIDKNVEIMIIDENNYSKVLQIGQTIDNISLLLNDYICINDKVYKTVKIAVEAISNRVILTVYETDKSCDGFTKIILE